MPESAESPKNYNTATIIALIALILSGINTAIIVDNKFLTPSYEDLIAQGDKNLENGVFDKAIDNYDSALAIGKSNDPFLLQNKGIALLNKGINNENIKIIRYSDGCRFLNYTESYNHQTTKESDHYFKRAFRCFEDAHNLKPSDLEIQFNYITTGLLISEGPDPISSYESIINQIDTYPEYKKTQYPTKCILQNCYYGMYLSHKKIGNYDQCDIWFTKYQNSSPGYPISNDDKVQ